MDNRDRQIAILNCNTVAAQLASKLDTNGSLIELVENYEALFEAVWKKVRDEIDGTAVVQRTFGAVEEVPSEAAHTPTQASMPTVPQGDLKVVGTQHGPLPAWLVQQCAAAQIIKVYDNRVDRDGNDITTNPANKRPWFKAADGSDKAFWPPKTGARR